MNTATTDWRQFNSNGNGLSKNAFNWTGENFQVYVRSSANINDPIIQQDLRSPFYPPLSGVSMQDNVLRYQYPILAERDFWPEMGWELLCADMGNCCNWTNAVENPFFALYNKRTGKIRAFLYKTYASEANGALMLLEFEGRKTALMAYANAMPTSVQEFDNNIMYRTPNHYTGETGYWLVGEFDAYYDPCTCKDGIGNSSLKFSFSLIETSDVNLTATGSIVSTVSADSKGGSPSNSGSSTSFGKDLSLPGAVSAGVKSYKDWSEYAKSFNKGWGAVSPYLKNLLIRKALASNKDTTTATSSAIKNLQELKIKEITKVVKGVASALPYVGVAIGLYNYAVSSLFSDETEVVTPPTSFDVNLNIEGTITTLTPVATRTISTPGSTIASPTTPNPIAPVYNNSLGVVGFLTRPKLAHKMYRGVDTCGGNNGPSNLYKARQFFMNDSLPYVVNPASGMEMVSIEAAYVLGYESNIFPNWNHPFSHQRYPIEWDYAYSTANYLDIPKRMEKIGMEVDYLLPGNVSYLGNAKREEAMRIRTRYVPLKYFRDLSFWLYYGSMFPNVGQVAPKVYIKLLCKLRLKENPDAPLVTILNTLDLGFATDSSISVQDTGYCILTPTIGCDHGNRYYSNLISAPHKFDEANNAIFNASPVTNASKLYLQTNGISGNVALADYYTQVDAHPCISHYRGNITSEDIMVLSTCGQTSSFSSGNFFSFATNTMQGPITFGETNVPQSQIGGKQKVKIDASNGAVKIVNTKITSNFENDFIKYMVDDQNATALDGLVNYVCNSTSYQNRSGGREAKPEQPQLVAAVRKKAISAMELYPNPSTTEFNLLIPGSGQVTVAVYNLAGQVQFSKDVLVEEGVPLNLPHNLARGVYAVKVGNGNKVETRKLIVK